MYCLGESLHCNPSEDIDIFYDAVSKGSGPCESHEQQQMLYVEQQRVRCMVTLEDSLLGCEVESIVCPDSVD